MPRTSIRVLFSPCCRIGRGRPFRAEEIEGTVKAHGIAPVVAQGVDLLRTQSFKLRAETKGRYSCGYAGCVDAGGQKGVGAARGVAALNARHLQQLTCIEGRRGKNRGGKAAGTLRRPPLMPGKEDRHALELGLLEVWTCAMLTVVQIFQSCVRSYERRP